METEFNLNEKRREVYLMLTDNFNHTDPHKVNEIIDKIIEQDKEFIRLLDQWKEIMRTWHIELPTIHLLCSEFDNFKNKLAGNKLIGEKDGTI